MIKTINFAELAGISRMQIQLEGEGQLTDEEFFQFCQQNRTLKFERTKEGKIVVMTPTGMSTGSRNSKIIIKLGIWNESVSYGEVFDSSTGFTLHDNSVLSPDASIIAQQRLDQLTQEEKDGFGHICPEFIVELKSKSDRIAALKAKMQDWINNGIQLGWLIDPDTETVYVYEPGKPMIEINGFDQLLSAGSVLPGFQLDLSVLR